MKFYLWRQTESKKWILQIPYIGMAGNWANQKFYSFERAVEYMNYLTKPRDYDWKTIHK